MSAETYVYVPEDLRARIPPLHATETESNPVVWVKLFTPDSSWSWYVIEYDGLDTCFGYVVGSEREMGYFLLSNLATLRGRLGRPVERDLHFHPKPLGDVQKEHEWE